MIEVSPATTAPSRPCHRPTRHGRSCNDARIHSDRSETVQSRDGEKLDWAGLPVFLHRIPPCSLPQGKIQTEGNPSRTLPAARWLESWSSVRPRCRITIPQSSANLQRRIAKNGSEFAIRFLLHPALAD